MKCAVIAIIYSEDKSKILTVKRRDVPLWVLPGGGVDPGESFEDAIIREIKEETGLVATILRQSGEYTPVSRLGTQTKVFECQMVEGSPLLTDETAGIGFFAVDEFPKPFFYIHKNWIIEAQSNPTTLTERPLTEVTCWNVLKYFFRNPLILGRFFFSWIGFPINASQ